MRVVGDCEANDLYDFKDKRSPTVFHCAVFKDLDSGKKVYFVPQTWTARVLMDYKGGIDVRGTHRLPDYLDQCTEIWMHNAIGYDRLLIRDIFDYHIDIMKLRDSLILSRMGNHATYHKSHPRLRRGHSVAYWAKWMGLEQQKVEHEDWTQFSLDMLRRCDVDCDIQERIVKTIEQELSNCSPSAIIEEMLFAEMLQEMHENGFYLYRHRAERFYQLYLQEANALRDKIHEAFPPKRVLVKKFVAEYRKPIKKEEKTWAPDDPRLLKKRHRDYLESKGLSLTTKTFDEYQDQEFNIGSPQQRVERLLEAGWKPEVFTPTGAPKSPKADDPSIQSEDLPEEVRMFGKWLVKNNRAATIKQWLDAVDDDGYVHGKIFNIGAWTNRCAHRDPNMANVPGRADPAKGITKQDVRRMRSAWGIEPESSVRIHDDMPVLVGCDAAGIQGRALAHYIAEATGEMEYVNLISDPNVDIHVYNMEAAGLSNRAEAKTFYYSYLLGVGYWKIARQVGVDPNEYPELLAEMDTLGIRDMLEMSLSFKDTPLTDENFAIATKGYKIKNDFEANVPGLKALQKEYIPKLAKQNSLVLPDGRRLAVGGKFEVMAGLLQGFETVVMRRTGIEMRYLLDKKNIPFKIRNFVHDEYQYETTRKHAFEVRQLFQERIEAVRNRYNIKCPLGVEVSPRKDTSMSWAGTH